MTTTIPKYITLTRTNELSLNLQTFLDLRCFFNHKGVQTKYNNRKPNNSVFSLELYWILYYLDLYIIFSIIFSVLSFLDCSLLFTVLFLLPALSNKFHFLCICLLDQSQQCLISHLLYLPSLPVVYLNTRCYWSVYLLNRLVAAVFVSLSFPVGVTTHSVRCLLSVCL